MDAEMEAQVHRVLAAFQDAATRHWGSDQPKNPADANYNRASRKKAPPRPEGPTRVAVRRYLTENPNATNREIIEATGCHKDAPATMRRKMGIPAGKRPQITQKVIMWDAIMNNPGLNASQIARLSISNPDYAAMVLREFKRANEVR